MQGKYFFLLMYSTAIHKLAAAESGRGFEDGIYLPTHPYTTSRLVVFKQSSIATVLVNRASEDLLRQARSEDTNNRSERNPLRFPHHFVVSSSARSAASIYLPALADPSKSPPLILPSISLRYCGLCRQVLGCYLHVFYLWQRRESYLWSLPTSSVSTWDFLIFPRLTVENMVILSGCSQAWSMANSIVNILLLWVRKLLGESYVCTLILLENLTLYNKMKHILPILTQPLTKFFCKNIKVQLACNTLDIICD